MKNHSNSYYFKNKKRNKLLKTYANNIHAYYKKIHPEIPSEEIYKAIKNIIKDNISLPEVSMLEFPTEGNIIKKKKSLLEFIDNIGYDTIINPHGVGYCQENIKKSLFTNIIEKDQADRNKIKVLMMKAQIAKDDIQYKLKYFAQLNKKIDMNSISGIMVKNVFFRSPPNYNAITSTVRFSIMAGYSFVELFVKSNLFLETEDDAINLITNLIQILPDKNKIDHAIIRYNLTIPSYRQVKDYFIDNLKYYNIAKTDFALLERYIDKLDKYELVFIYYAFNGKHIFQDNIYFRNWLSKLCEIDIENHKTTQTDTPDSDLIIMIISMFPDIIKNNSLNDALHIPEIKSKINDYYFYFHDCMKDIQEIFDLFIFIPIAIPKISHHYQMMRKTTILSDTDSVIFSLTEFAEWFLGKIKLNAMSFKINAIFIYLITKALIHVFAYISANMNADERNIKKIAMKNEYLYSVFLRTAMAKHYAGLNILREGNVLSPPKLDLKGKQLVGSDLCQETLDKIKSYITYILNEISTNYKLDHTILIKKITDFEQKIIISLHKKKNTYLTQVPVNNKEDYKFPLVSQYFNYMLYMEVFSEKYSEIHIPQKCKVVPINILKYSKIDKIEYMKKINLKAYNRLVEFLKQYPKKEITRIIIPLEIDIPDEILPIIDYRSVVYKNCYPLYLVNRGLGLSTLGHNKSKVLFSDIYL